MGNHIRHGKGSVRPYIYGNVDLPNFVREVFGANELERLDAPMGGCHLEAMIGGSIVVIEAAESFPPGAHPTTNSIYVYVEDVDQAYQRAIKIGATSIAAPESKPYHERACGVKDSFGNTWWIATYTG